MEWVQRGEFSVGSGDSGCGLFVLAAAGEDLSSVLLFQAVNIGGFQFPAEPALVGTFQINSNHSSGVIHL